LACMENEGPQKWLVWKMRDHRKWPMTFGGGLHILKMRSSNSKNGLRNLKTKTIFKK